MNKLESKEILKLLDILIGGTTAIGESNYDEKVGKNLETLIDVTNWCLDKIYQSSETCGAVEYSKNKVGFVAKCCLEEYKTWLEEMFEE